MNQDKDGIRKIFVIFKLQIYTSHNHSIHINLRKCPIKTSQSRTSKRRQFPTHKIGVAPPCLPPSSQPSPQPYTPRPLQPLPLTFTPVLLFSTYLNLSGYTIDSAGLTSAWSGLYLLLANRRKASGKNMYARVGSRFGARGIVRGTAMGIAALNLVGGGITYAFGKRGDEDKTL
ncbi:hypothetical protein EYC84_005798 [Monilinia fructicola]|uniref:Uncharacterized protein n=1 Tax=Monilinia fructicola TaxID=38448 RepID=A0A5M9K086_MONFR|nr:hypothetical protein EYC84_005798 [Monilinia fructicola]